MRNAINEVWTVVVFGYSGETRRRFYTEAEARDYASKARKAGCLARIEVGS